MCTLNDHSIANKFALFADNFYQCNADLFVKNETLLSDNDPVICNAIASPRFKLFSFPKSTCNWWGYASSVYFYFFSTALLDITHLILVQ